MSVQGSRNDVLVDTSSFIDYFRYSKPLVIPALALSDSILLSKIVRLELLKGTRRNERKKLLYFLDGLKQIEQFPTAELCENVLLILHGRGLNLGLADIIILSDAIKNRCMLLTSDKKLRQAASILGVKLVRV